MRKNRVEEYRRMYPPGTRVRLTADIEDPFTPKKTGDVFTVDYVDDLGQLHGRWESGGCIAVIPETDSFEILKE